MLYEWTAPYIEFTLRRLQNRTFGPATSETSLSDGGVAITLFSPLVPAATQQLIESEKQRLSVGPWTERVFCAGDNSDLMAANGSVVVARGNCLTQAQYESMDWFVSRTQDLGVFVAPLQYAVQYVAQQAFVVMIAFAALVVSIQLTVG